MRFSSWGRQEFGINWGRFSSSMQPLPEASLQSARSLLHSSKLYHRHYITMYYDVCECMQLSSVLSFCLSALDLASSRLATTDISVN